MTTPLLDLDELAAAQSQPHVLINRALRRLDAAVSLAVGDKDLSTPPGSPVDGDRYIVGPAPSGDWAGHTDEIAFYSGGWNFLTPLAGWIAWVADEGTTYQYGIGSPTGWRQYAPGVTISNTGSPGDTVPNVTSIIFNGATVQQTGPTEVSVAVSGGAGGGGAGGSDGEMQANNAGALIGVPGLRVNSGRAELAAAMVLDGITAPAAPGSTDGNALVYGEALGSLVLPWARPYGMSPLFMAGVFGKRERSAFSYSSTTYNEQGSAPFGTTGSAGTTNRSAAATTKFGQTTRRTGTSSAATNSTGAAGLSSYAVNTAVYVSVSGRSDMGGFLLMMRGGWPTVRSDQRIFFGLRGSAGSTGEPSAFTDVLGVGADEADTNLQWFHNDGAGSVTKVDTGVAKTTLGASLLELRVFVPAGGGVAHMLLINHENGNTYTQSPAANLPSADAPLGPVVWANTGTTTATAVEAHFNGWYCLEDVF